jgi:hypothetical protein
VHDQPGILAERAEGMSEKAQIPVPKEFLREDGKIGVEKNLQISRRWPNA